MATIIRAQNRCDVTVPGGFIYKYMPSANGDFVKTYIYILSCYAQGRPFDVVDAADILETSERDITRAIKYWHEKGVICAVYDKKNLTSITLLSPWEDEEEVLEAEDSEESEVLVSAKNAPGSAPVEAASAPDYGEGEAITLSAREIKKIESDPKFNDLLDFAQTFFKKMFSSSDYEKFLYFYERMHRNAESCEAIITYCGRLKKTSNMKSIDKKSIECIENDCITPKQVDEFLLHQDRCEVVRKAIGIKTSFIPADYENLVDIWFTQYGFSEEVVRDACKRGFGKERPFEYVDKILSKWSDAGIKTLEDVKEADKKFSEDLNAQSKAVEKKYADRNKSNRFNQFDQRDIDFNADAEALFK
ncbi:MAG: DnaD domain protein [Lachnospiraceae bacterium]|nr:DnaD domain protein [Lachnospiraceae bacterium]